MEILTKYHIIHSYLGLTHIIFAIFALLFGTVVLLNPKGSEKHRRIGYAYVISMILMNATAMGIYNFGKANVFHFFIILSLFTLTMGIYPALKRTQNWLSRHYYFMSWSVVGLYCAFWAEMGVRLFDMRAFWWVVMVATMVTSAIGGVVIHKLGKKIKAVNSY